MITPILLALLLPLPAEEGFTPLFDGKSLQGWKRYGGKAEAWAVEDGLLVSKGEGGGWLGTEKRRSSTACIVPSAPALTRTWRT